MPPLEIDDWTYCIIVYNTLYTIRSVCRYDFIVRENRSSVNKAVSRSVFPNRLWAVSVENLHNNEPSATCVACAMAGNHQMCATERQTSPVM